MLALVALAIQHAPYAAADVWGYVDEQGRAHVATEKLDDRYQLFFKGRTSADAVVPPPPAQRDESFKETAIYQRIVNHPNAARFEPMIVRYARQQNVDAALVKAVVAVESAFDPEAVSAKGAIGLMQVIPETAQRYGVNDDKRRTVGQKLLDPAVNLYVGTRHLRTLLAMYAGDIALTLAAYNAGEGTVLRYDNQVPPFPETQEFVQLVQQFYAMYQPPPPPVRSVTKPSRLTIPPRGPAPR
ncbi:MAG: lytic transglycosylase domain-containing protein [Casimicrobiaceae bacterium]